MGISQLTAFCGIHGGNFISITNYTYVCEC